MKTPVCSLLAVTALLLAFPPSLRAVETEFSPSLQFSTGLAGNQNKLTWTAGPPGTRYVIRSSTDASNWRDRAVVEAEGTTGVWLDPEPAGPRVFYQVVPPVASVFSVEPAVLAPGAVLVITGQCLPAGSSVVFEIEGIPDVSAPIIIGPDGRMTVTLPAFDLITQPGTGMGPHVRLARVVAPGGGTVVVIGQTFEATLSGFASDSPPVMPRVLWKAKTSEAQNTIGAIQKARTAPVPNIPPIPGMCPGMVMLSGPSGLGTFTSIPGEVCVEQCDLELATPAGPSLDLVRTYRSLGGEAGVAGSPGGILCGSWCSNFDMRIEPVPLAAGTGAPRLIFHSGDGRRNVLVRQADGTYSCDGMFRTGQFSPDTSFTLTFADQSRMIFCPLVGAPWSGRIGSIADRNGVALTWTYSAAGQLSTVSSQFGQSLTFGYDTDGRLSTATDHTGRTVAYSFYRQGETGGPPGSLKSASCPTIPGQAPVRGPVVYTYSTGSTDPRLNGNLLKVTDGAGQLVTAWTYSSSTNPGAPDFDRCVTCDRWKVAVPGPVVHFSYEFLAPGSGGGGAGGLLCITCDELGGVTETRCDRQHRPVSVRAFTTFATPDLPVTSTTNRPPAPPNPNDPAFVEVTCAWNPDHLCTCCTEEDGLQTLTTYDRELRRDCPRRECGNARVITLVCPDASEPRRVISCDYQPGFGIVEGKKGLNAVNVKLARSSAAFTTIKIPGVDHEFSSRKGYEYYKARSDLASAGLHQNPYFQDNALQGDMPGSRMARPDYRDDDDDDDRIANSPGNPIKGISRKGGRNPGGNIGAQDRVVGGNGDGRFRSLPVPYAEPTSDFVDGLGGGKEFIDDWEMPAAFCTRLTTTTGQVFTASHDTRGNQTASTTPIAGSGSACTYNTLGQLTSVTVLNGAGSSFSSLCQYDPVTHYLTGVVRDPDLNGDGSGLHLSTTCERNARGLITRVVGPRGFDTLCTYDASDRVVTVTSPPSSNDPLTATRTRCELFYDVAGWPVRWDVGEFDAAGLPVAGGQVYSSFRVRDSRGRVVQEAVEQKPVAVPPGVTSPATAGIENFAVCDYTLDAAGQCVSVSTPAVCRGAASDRVCDFEFNALGLLSAVIEGGTGNPGAVRTGYSYTMYGIQKGARTIAPAGSVSPEVSSTFDAWRRPATFTDEMGNVTSFSYDNQGYTTVELHGEVNDVPGPAANVLLARGRGRSTNLHGIVFNYGAVPRSGSLSVVIMGDARAGLRLKKVIDGDNRSIGGDDDQDGSLAGRRRGDVKFNDISVSKHMDSAGARSAGGGRFRPAFFDVFTDDDVWTWERFAPGEPAPHATETTTMHHSPAGLTLSVTCNGDTLRTFGYDTAARRNLTVCPGATSTACTHDASGNVTACTVTAFSTIPGTPPETFTVTALFNPKELCVSRSDSMGNTHTCAYDFRNRPVSETLPGGLTIHSSYDTVSTTGTYASYTRWTDYNQDSIPDIIVSSVCLSGECVSVTDGAGYPTTFTNDALGRTTRSDFADGTFETTTFNTLGLPVSHQRKNGAVIACDFDYKERARTITVSNLPPGVVSVPPTECVWSGLDDCVQTTEGPSIIVRVRDSLGNLTSESQNGHTVSHTYNHRGCTGTVYPSGERFSEVRNAQGQLLSFSIITAQGATPISQCDYSGFACVREVRRDGVITTRDIRSDNEPPLVLGGGLPDFSFGQCVRTTITGPNGALLENHLTRRNEDQCEVQNQRTFSSVAAPPSRRMTFTLDERNFVTGCLTQVREVPGGPVTTESDVHYELDIRGQRLSTTGGPNSGLYSSSSAAPLFDHQMGQYSSWPGGALLWTLDGDLSFLGRTGGGISILYDAWSRAVEVLDHTGASLASYGYDADSRRISRTLPGGAGSPPVTTFLLYDGPDCIQELDALGVPEMSYAVSGGAHHCIITRNGSTYYPHGGGSGGSTDFVFPILPAWIEPLKEVPVDDDITLTLTCLTLPGGGSSPRVGGCCDTADCSLLTTSTGAPYERFAFSDSSQPILLSADGRVRPGATRALTGYHWLFHGNWYDADSGLYHGPGGLYSPELGQPVSAHKTKPKEKAIGVNGEGKKEYTGHVTLLK